MFGSNSLERRRAHGECWMAAVGPDLFFSGRQSQLGGSQTAVGTAGAASGPIISRFACG